MIAAVANSKSTRWDHRALRVKSRVVGINISSRARTEASAASRARMRWENQWREPDLAADRVKYLQPEPMLQQPAVVVATAKQGQSMPAYAYAYNNPLKFTDPTGLYSWIGSCSTGGVAISVEVDRSGTQNADGTWPTEINKWKTNSTVQFRTSEADACRDYELGVQMKQFVPTASLTCWTRLLEQMWEECRKRSPPPEVQACR